MSNDNKISSLIEKISLSDRPSCAWVKKEEVIKIVMDHFNVPEKQKSF